MNPRHIVAALCVSALASCTPPIRQFDLKDQSMSCDEANRFAYESMKSLGYTISTFTPAVPGTAGVVKGSTEEKHRSGSATVVVTCGGAGPTIDASEDGKWLGQVDFKRAFYMTFVSLVSQKRALDKATQEQAALPIAQRRQQGFEVLITPLRGLDARLDLPADLTPAGVLPVRIVINNRTGSSYRLDAGDIVMVRSDGTRVQPLSVDEVVERVRSGPAPATGAAPPDLANLAQQLRLKLFTVDDVRPDGSAQGLLFFPLDLYRRARVLVTESQSEETEGIVVEF